MSPDHKNKQPNAILSAIAAVSGLVIPAHPLHLTAEQIARAWESPEYRETLSQQQKEQIPVNPAGQIQLTGKIGDFASTTNNCSTDNCSGNNCSTNNCSGNNCSTDNCSGNNCSTDNCSGINCGMMVG